MSAPSISEATTPSRFFGAGVASFLAPCVVPLVPAYLGLVVGRRKGDAGDTAKVVPATMIFVVGCCVGVRRAGRRRAGGIGSSLDGVQTWVERVGGVLVILMGRCCSSAS